MHFKSGKPQVLVDVESLGCEVAVYNKFPSDRSFFSGMEVVRCVTFVTTHF